MVYLLPIPEEGVKKWCVAFRWPGGEPSFPPTRSTWSWSPQWWAETSSARSMQTLATAPSAAPLKRFASSMNLCLCCIPGVSVLQQLLRHACSHSIQGDVGFSRARCALICHDTQGKSLRRIRLLTYVGNGCKVSRGGKGSPGPRAPLPATPPAFFLLYIVYLPRGGHGAMFQLSEIAILLKGLDALCN